MPSSDRIESRRLETYARTLLEASKAEDHVYENLAPLIAQSEASPEVLAVLAKMSEQGDLDRLPEVLDLYRSMVNEEQDVVGVHVTTAIPLDDELRDLITQKCESDLESRVFLIEHVDPTIIGGIILSARGQRRDASVRTQLENARKIMTIPLYSSLLSIAANIVLNLILMWPLKQGGIALATVFASMLNNAILLTCLHREGFQLQGRRMCGAFLRALLFSLAVGVPLFFAYPLLRGWLSFRFVGEFPAFCVLVLCFCAGYFGLHLLFRTEEPREFFGMLRETAAPPYQERHEGEECDYGHYDLEPFLYPPGLKGGAQGRYPCQCQHRGV